MAADMVIDAMDASSSLRLGVVLVWLVVTPLGAWTIWKRTAPRDEG